MQPQLVFSAEEIASLQAKITAAVKEALDKHFGPPVQIQPQQSTQQATQATQQFIPPAPQVQKEEDEQQQQEQEQEQKPLYQATVEDDAETIAESTKYGNNMLTGSKSHDSKQLCRKWAPHTGFLATSLASSFGALFGRLATFFFGTFLASQLGYIRCMEEMEASGEG